MKHKRVTLSEIDGFVRDGIFAEHKDSSADAKALFIRRALLEYTSEKQKRYLIMYYKHNMTMDEIADECGVAKSTVSRTVARGRERIIKGLRDEQIRQLLAGTESKGE